MPFLEILSHALLGMSTILAILNIFFIVEHADMCRNYQKPRHPVINKNIKRFEKIVLKIGIIILFLITTSCLLHPFMIKVVLGPYLVYKISLPPIAWILGYLVPNKKPKKNNPKA